MSDSRQCCKCGRWFAVCKYNSSRQKYCKYLRCVRARKRERQREQQKRRYRIDPAFQEAKRQRSREYARHRRREAKVHSQCPSPDVGVMDILTGMVSQLADEKDPVLLREKLFMYGSRGRQLSQPAALAMHSP